MNEKHNIWKIGLFTRLGKNKAECLDCKEKQRYNYTFTLSDGNVGSLKAHLSSNIHKNSEYSEKYIQLGAEKNANQSSSGSLNNFVVRSSGLTYGFILIYTWIFTGNIGAHEKKVINFVVSKNLPFNIINDPSFRSICTKSEDLHDESYYRKVVLSRVFKLVKTKINNELNSCVFMSFTTLGNKEIFSGD